MPIQFPAQLESIYQCSCKSEIYTSVEQDAKAALKDVTNVPGNVLFKASGKDRSM